MESNGVVKSISKRGRKKKKNYKSNKNFILKSLKSVAPDLGIKEDALRLMDNLVEKQCVSIIVKASEVSRHNDYSTILPGHVDDAIKLLYPKEMAIYLSRCANEAKAKYMSSFPPKAEISTSFPEPMGREL